MIIVGGTQVTETPPTTPVDHSRPGLAVTWTSWTGQSWEISSVTSPLMLMPGVTGLGMINPQHRWGESPTIDGAAWEGARTGLGEVFLPLAIGGVNLDVDGFLSTHAEFMRSIDPHRTGLLRVTRPDGRWREIVCRYVQGADNGADVDPVWLQSATYGITLATPDPYWLGEAVSYRFVSEGDTGFFPGPPFTLGRGLTLTGSTTTNPGDIEAYPVWRVHGPFTGFSVGVGAAVASLSLTRASGEWVEVDMTPRKLTILDSAGVDRWDAATTAQFEPIPPGAEVGITTSVTGAGADSAVELSFTPRYRRAW